MEIQLIKADEDDCETIHRMQRAAFEALLAKYQDYETSPAAETLAQVRARFASPQTDHYFIMLRSERVGCIRINNLPDDVCRLSSLFIMPDYRGKGYAQEAMRQVELLYPRAARWRLDTIKQETKLCYLYEKMGYRQTGAQTNVRDGMDIVDYAKQGARMEYKTRQYPLFSACGLNCGLCPRYYTAGVSRCPGCAGEGFSAVHPACGVLSCCRKNGLEHCCFCAQFPCKRYDGADQSDSFITHQNQLRDFEKAKRVGIAAYMAELDEKIRLLTALLHTYDDGRRKSLFCTAVNLLELADIRAVVERLANSVEDDAPPKEKAEAAVRLIGELAEVKGISLKLRKRVK